MGLFSKNKVSHEAEREALALEAAVMARIATITTSHDRQTFDEDQADMELLASMSTGSATVDPAAEQTLVMPDILLAALANPTPAAEAGLPDYSSMIPVPLTLQGTDQSSEMGWLPLATEYRGVEASMGFAEAQAEAPTPDYAALTAPTALADMDQVGMALATPSWEHGEERSSSAEQCNANPTPVAVHAVYSEPSYPEAPTSFEALDVQSHPIAAGAADTSSNVDMASFVEHDFSRPIAEHAGVPAAPPVTAYEPEAPTAPDRAAASEPVKINANPFAVTPEYLAGNALLAETTKHLRSIGAVNILVAGQTGVGKSTLVNSVFGEAFAATSAGSPVTQHAEWFVSDTVPLRILDTRGLEAKDYSVTLNALRAEIDNSRAQHDEKNQLHMAWVCISTPSSRVQECEIDIIKLLNKYSIPVIIVLTKYDDDEEFPGIVERIVTEKGALFTAVVAVRALARKTRPAVGLEELVMATFTALPVAHKAAFAAAQKINRDLNRTTAETYVTVAASAAAAASVIPIPFADMATIAPIQASMLVGISNAFGVQLERAQIMQLLSTVLGCLAITMAGGWIIGSILKFIPGPGSVIGAMMNATVAGALTRTLGRTYIKFLYAFLEVNRRLPTADEIFDLFPTFYKAGRKVAA